MHFSIKELSRSVRAEAVIAHVSHYSHGREAEVNRKRQFSVVFEVLNQLKLFPNILYTRFPTIWTVFWSGLLWFLWTVVRFGWWSVIQPAGRSVNMSVLSCLPQGVKWRVCERSVWRGVKRNPADGNKHQHFHSSQGLDKNHLAFNSLPAWLCKD